MVRILLKYCLVTIREWDVVMRAVASVCACPSVCSDIPLTFEWLDLQTSFLVCRYSIFRISKPRRSTSQEPKNQTTVIKYTCSRVVCLLLKSNIVCDMLHSLRAFVWLLCYAVLFVVCALLWFLLSLLLSFLSLDILFYDTSCLNQLNDDDRPKICNSLRVTNYWR